ncbi:hypothetical protein [Piscinibacter sp. XHJ-5]|uniref:hypothetical protein n=1 Tax=Piscinibacter sp. XHJ-5 TaxID=3037797 RepID=UPI002452EDF9|nr:hypothetical protein [Piscinibacter sp. XHJ-5]
MNFVERDEGDFRIYAGAIEARRTDGYSAAVVVQRVRGVDVPVETFRDESLCGGYAWPTAEAALSFALRKATAAIHAVPRRAPAPLPEVARVAAAAGRSVGRRPLRVESQLQAVAM